MSKIEGGMYKARGIEGSVQKGTSKKGTEQIALDLKITSPGPELGKQVTTFLFFSPDAEPYALDRLAALGCTGAGGGKYPGISANEVDVQIRYEQYEGKEQMKVDIYTGGGRPVIKNVMQGQEERAFDDRVSRALKNRGADPTATPSGAAPVAGEAPAASGKYGAL